jgi:transposase
MDLGDKSHAFCLLDEAGEVAERLTVANRVDHINAFFDAFAEESASVRVVMESGTHSPWISHLLADRGFEVLVGNARKLRAIWQSDRKDDCRDAEMLARIGRFDLHLLHPIQHRSMRAQSHLAIIRARDALVRSRTSLISCARGLVKSCGGRLPQCSAPAFAARVACDVPPELAPAIKPLLCQIATLSANIRRYDRCIERCCRQCYPETAPLLQISGVGSLTALAFILTLEDPSRFKKDRSVGPFLGLTPKRDQSGDVDKQLPISKAGDGYLRRLLTQSAHYILGPFGPDCDLRRFGLRIVERGGRTPKKRAATAVARKLSVLLMHLWRTGERYEPFRRQGAGTDVRVEPAA